MKRRWQLHNGKMLRSPEVLRPLAPGWSRFSVAASACNTDNCNCPSCRYLPSSGSGELTQQVVSMVHKDATQAGSVLGVDASDDMIQAAIQGAKQANLQPSSWQYQVVDGCKLTDYIKSAGLSAQFDKVFRYVRHMEPAVRRDADRTSCPRVLQQCCCEYDKPDLYVQDCCTDAVPPCHPFV